MAAIVKWIGTNPKKSIAIGCVSAYIGSYIELWHRESLIRKDYFLKARKYGRQPIKSFERPRKVLVFLNPAAKDGKSKYLFEKNILPMLHLAGLEVTVVKTESEGQAKDYMGVMDESVTDAILVAGGDGTVSEILVDNSILFKTAIAVERRHINVNTPYLHYITSNNRTLALAMPLHTHSSRSLHNITTLRDLWLAQRTPLAVVPLGRSNSLCKLISPAEVQDNTIKWVCDSTLSLIESKLKAVDVMSLKEVGGDRPPVYAVGHLRWGAFTETERTHHKYWYFGPLKRVFAFTKKAFLDGVWPAAVKAALEVEEPCDGCSKCFTPWQPTSVWQQWHSWLSPPPPDPRQSRENPDCGKVHQQDIDCTELTLLSSNYSNEDAGPSLEVHSVPTTLSKMDFVQARKPKKSCDVENFREGKLSTDKNVSSAQSVTLVPDLQNVSIPDLQHSASSWFSIDSEYFEAMPVKIEMLKKKLVVFISSEQTSESSSN